jgi:mono/diheme cytochrome c family protein
MQHRFRIVAVLAGALALATWAGCNGDGTPTHFVDENWATADIVDGGKLYDKWWSINGGTEPTTDFDPIWASQSTNTRTGGDTWRCKECHGWDYVGAAGRYSSGSHFTGFPGVFASRTKARTTLFEAIKGEGADHDMSGVLSDTDVLDLTKFIVDGLVDMSLYIDANGLATGNATAGQSLYDATCPACHGADGDMVDFEADPGVQGVGWLADDNPQETLHKIRWGHPGTAMPSMVDQGLSDQQIGDILAYAQTLPTAPFVNANWATADIVDGGKLYDKWWSVNAGTEPTTDFDPIWASQSTNTRTGGDTWRCKECHGWDYVGQDGRYSSGSHFTGFEGVWASRTKAIVTLFESIKGEGADHDMSGVLSDTDVLDLTKFVVDGLVDMSLYMDFSTGLATGNATAGQSLYNSNCSVCHGADGKTFDFEPDPGVQGVGWLANDNPQETLHKIRWGHPGTAMPSMVDQGLSDTEIGDILAYAQTLPQS